MYDQTQLDCVAKARVSQGFALTDSSRPQTLLPTMHQQLQQQIQIRMRKALQHQLRAVLRHPVCDCHFSRQKPAPVTQSHENSQGAPPPQEEVGRVPFGLPSTHRGSHEPSQLNAIPAVVKPLDFHAGLHIHNTPVQESIGGANCLSRACNNQAPPFFADRVTNLSKDSFIV